MVRFAISEVQLFLEQASSVSLHHSFLVEVKYWETTTYLLLIKVITFCSVFIQVANIYLKELCSPRRRRQDEARRCLHGPHQPGQPHRDKAVRWHQPGLEPGSDPAATCAGRALAKIDSLWENKDIQFLLVTTSTESSVCLRIRLPQHKVATKHLFLSPLHLKAFHWEVIQHGSNSTPSPWTTILCLSHSWSS